MTRRSAIPLHRVAQLAGVSTPTVSRVFNNKPVADVTRQRVMNALRALEDENPSASRRIGLLLPDLQNEFFREFFRSLDDHFQGTYTLVAMNSNRKADLESQRLAALLSMDLAGLILVSTGESSPESLAEQLTSSRNVPTVVFDHRYDLHMEERIGDLPVDFVTSDSRRGTQQAVLFLKETGFTNLGYVSGPPTVDTAKDRLASFEQALAIARLERDPLLTFPGTYQLEDGRLAAENWYLPLKDRPDAVLFGNDVMAIGFMQRVTEEGIVIGRDVGVVGFDDIQAARYVTPPLATISQRLHPLATAIHDLLHERVSGEYHGAAREVRLATDFQPRESAGFTMASQADD